MTKVTEYNGYTISEDNYGRGFRVHSDRVFFEAWFRSVSEAKQAIDQN